MSRTVRSRLRSIWKIWHRISPVPCLPRQPRLPHRRALPHAQGPHPRYCPQHLLHSFPLPVSVPDISGNGHPHIHHNFRAMHVRTISLSRIPPPFHLLHPAHSLSRPHHLPESAQGSLLQSGCQATSPKMAGCPPDPGPVLCRHSPCLQSAP